MGYYDENVFRDFIKDSAKEFPHLRIQYLREYQALGTAGGLYHFRDAILKGNPERFFVLNADVCCSFPLGEMLKLFEEKDAEAVILGTRVTDEAASNFGCLVSDSHTKRVLHYVEKPESHISNLINCGVYLFTTECIFPSIRSAIKRRTARPRLVCFDSDFQLPHNNSRTPSIVINKLADAFGSLRNIFYFYKLNRIFILIMVQDTASKVAAVFRTHLPISS